jgi:hypothetical protein
MQAAFSKAMVASASASALLPRHMAWANDFLADAYLRDLLAVETYRVGQSAITSVSDPGKPPARLRELEHPRTGAVPPMVETAAQNVQNIKGQYAPEFAIPKPARVVTPPAGEPVGVPSGDLTPAGDLQEKASTPAAPGNLAGRVPSEPLHENAAGAIHLNGGDATGYFARVGNGDVQTRFAAIAPEPPEAAPATTVAGAFEMALPVPAPAAFADVFAKDSQP